MATTLKPQRVAPPQQAIEAALLQNGWFQRQKPKLQQALVAGAIAVHAEAGRWLYDAGDEAFGLYGVISGTVSIHIQMKQVAGAEGDYALSNIVGPSAIFGYAGRLVGKRRLVTAVVRDEAQLFYISEARIEAIAREQPDLWLHFAELASEQLVDATRAMVVNARAKPALRVAMHLRAMIGTAKPPHVINITQDELAELAGLSRKTVNLVLADLEKSGRLVTRYRSIQVADVADLIYI
jgi:CRP-like cAMP-binding protein